jgi:prepilin-type N-terminal cleavage/methylation domain-containing protein
MNKKAHGFTIVELLIVIVVIAILATISIAAYTNIQDRAKNAATISAVEQTIKAIHMYNSKI